MKVITESEMNFGKFDETELFHIEDSRIYKELGSGIKTVEFVLKYGQNSILFLEAKKSCPNAANRSESAEKEGKFEEYYASITEKSCITADIFGSNSESISGHIGSRRKPKINERLERRSTEIYTCYKKCRRCYMAGRTISRIKIQIASD